MEKIFIETNYSPVIAVLKILLYLFEGNKELKVEVNQIEEIGDEYFEKDGEKLFLKTGSIMNLEDFLSFIIRRYQINNLNIIIIENNSEIINIKLEDSEVLNFNGKIEKKVKDFIENYLSTYLY